jgi:hypothetical protein
MILMRFENFKKYQCIDCQITTYQTVGFGFCFSFNQTARFSLMSETGLAYDTNILKIQVS